MRRNLFFSLFLLFSLGLGVSSCAPGVYAGVNYGAPYPYYGAGAGYYGPRYYAPRPIIVAPAYRGGYGGGDRGWHGGHGGGGYGGHGGGYGGGGGRRGGR